MNKVVCNICGTSYPENAPQCPICGYVQNAEKMTSTDSGEDTYTYVKGGRFSKSNVKKRNQAHAAEIPPAAPANPSENKQKKSNAGLIILLVVLLLAIIAVTGYIAMRFFIPNDFFYEGLGSISSPDDTQETEPPTQESSMEATEETETTTLSLECTAVSLSDTEIQLDGIGSNFILSVTLEPENTPDAVRYATSDESVATVSNSGVITVAGEGTAIITVSCGSASAQCKVVCTDPAAQTETLAFNRKEITFKAEGESWLLYEGTIPVEDIVWTSDDNKIATITDGKVVAVGNGDTVIYGLYKDQAAHCLIHCVFDGAEDGGNGNISEASGDTNMTYQLYNPYGNATDATIRSGEKFTLKFVDENLKEVTGVEWTVKDENICSFENNIVEGKSTGTTTVTATYNGKTYSCTVRVI